MGTLRDIAHDPGRALTAVGTGGLSEVARPVIGWAQGDDIPQPAGQSAEDKALIQKQIESIDAYLKQAGIQSELAAQLLPLMLSEAGIDAVTDPATGKTTYQKRPPTQDELLSQQVETAANQRTLSAIKGELPVSPALETDLAKQEASLRQESAQSLGQGWETGTPGIETLARERDRQATTREAVRFGELSNLNAIAQSRGGQRMAQTGQNVGIAQGANQGGLQAAELFGNSVGLIESPLDQSFQERALQYNAAAQKSIRKQQRLQMLLDMVGKGAQAFAAGGGAPGVGASPTSMTI